MIVKATLSKDMKPTEEQIRMIEAAKKMPVCYDEDSPEMTSDMEKAFRLAAKSRNRIKKTIVS